MQINLNRKDKAIEKQNNEITWHANIHLKYILQMMQVDKHIPVIRALWNFTSTARSYNLLPTIFIYRIFIALKIVNCTA